MPRRDRCLERMLLKVTWTATGGEARSRLYEAPESVHKYTVHQNPTQTYFIHPQEEIAFRQEKSSNKKKNIIDHNLVTSQQIW